MKTKNHVYISTLLSGGLYAATKSPNIAIPFLLSGIFIDIDHVFDFLIFSREKFTIRNMLSWCNDCKWEKIYLVFHSYEVLSILAIITYYFPQNVLLGITMGSGVHLILDQVGNCHFNKKFKLSPLFYFLTYRYFAGFRKEKMLKPII